MNLTWNQTLMLKRIRDGISIYLGALGAGRNAMIGRDNTRNSLVRHKLLSRSGRLTVRGRKALRSIA